MGQELFGIDISGLIDENISPGVFDATLIQVTPGTRTAGQLSGGTNPTTLPFAARGFVDKLDRKRIEGTLVEDTDVLVALMGDSIASAQVPKPGDRVTILGTTYNIIMVDTDPALAVYNCVGRASN